MSLLGLTELRCPLSSQLLMSFIISATDVDTGEKLHYKLQQWGEQVGGNIIFRIWDV